jgi:hypothetical protein
MSSSSILVSSCTSSCSPTSGNKLGYMAVVNAANCDFIISRPIICDICKVPFVIPSNIDSIGSEPIEVCKTSLICVYIITDINNLTVNQRTLMACRKKRLTPITTPNSGTTVVHHWSVVANNSLVDGNRLNIPITISIWVVGSHCSSFIENIIKFNKTLYT